MHAKRRGLSAPLKLVLTAATVFFLMILGCSGGFGTDSNGAADLGPGIFGTDSTK